MIQGNHVRHPIGAEIVRRLLLVGLACATVLGLLPAVLEAARG